MFPNKFDVGIAYVLKVGLLELFLNFYLLGVTFFLNFFATIF
jgi:hypothetical protein